jgi:hypothetical protein
LGIRISPKQHKLLPFVTWNGEILVLEMLGVSAHGRRHIGRLAVIAVLAVVASLGLVACGGGGASSEEIVKAEKRGRHYRMEQERKRKIEKELKELRRDQRRGRQVVATPPATPEAAPSPPESSHSSCGGSLSVGPDTTCTFAENVRAEYESEIGSGSGTVYAYSPANNEIYEMFCTAAPHECSGAIDATVYFP